jgi:hypothetical protein
MILEQYLLDKLDRRLNPHEYYDDDNDDAVLDDDNDPLGDNNESIKASTTPQKSRPYHSTWDYFRDVFSPTSTGTGAAASAGGKKTGKLKSKKKRIIQRKRKTGKNRKLRTKLKK